MDFGGLGKLASANPAHLPKWAGLAGTSLPGPPKSILVEFFLGINYCFAHKKASKNPEFEDMFFRRYFRWLLNRFLIIFGTVLG